MSRKRGLTPIYVDSSILVALLAPDDPHHRAARAWVRRHPASLLSSTIAEVEVGRALRRRNAPESLRSLANRVLARLDLVELTAAIRASAIQVRPSNVRSLDALHVATALAAGSVQFATVDVRQAVAAEEMGLGLVKLT